MLKDGVRYWWTVTCTEAQTLKTARVRIRYTISSTHIPPGLLSLPMRELKPQAEQWRPQSGSCPAPSQRTPKRAGTLNCCLVHEHKQQSGPNTERQHFCPLRENCNTPAESWRAFSKPTPPITRSNSSKEESLTPRFKKVSFQTWTVSWGEPDYIQPTSLNLSHQLRLLPHQGSDLLCPKAVSTTSDQAAKSVFQSMMHQTCIAPLAGDVPTRCWFQVIPIGLGPTKPDRLRPGH